MLRVDRVARCCNRVVSVRSSCGHFVCFSEFSVQFICGNSRDVIRKLLVCNGWRENGQNCQQTEIAEKSESVRIFLHVPCHVFSFCYSLVWLSRIHCHNVTFFSFCYLLVWLSRIHCDLFSIENTDRRYACDILFWLNEVRICNKIYKKSVCLHFSQYHERVFCHVKNTEKLIINIKFQLIRRVYMECRVSDGMSLTRERQCRARRIYRRWCMRADRVVKTRVCTLLNLSIPTSSLHPHLISLFVRPYNSREKPRQRCS